MTITKIQINQECFVDAADEFANAAGDICCRDELADQNELKSRLEEVRKVLRLALNNEFISALDICGPK